MIKNQSKNLAPFLDTSGIDRIRLKSSLKIWKETIIIPCLLVFILSCSNVVPETHAQFTITISNVSTGENATVLSEGVFFTHPEGFPLFYRSSLDYGKGLEELAEDGLANRLFENLLTEPNVKTSGRFAEILPGNQTSFSFSARYGEFFNFATMFTDSNDGFYSFDEEGIHLFEPGGEPFRGNITTKVWLWDAGTEANNRPYGGEGQPGKGMAAFNEGTPTLEAVRLMNDQFTYPGKKEIIKITIEAEKI